MRKWIFVFMGIGVVIVLALSMRSGKKVETLERSRAQQATVVTTKPDPREWPLIPMSDLPPIPAYMQRKAFVLPPAGSVYSQVELAQYALNNALAQHPGPAQQLQTLLAKGEILLSFDQKPGSAAGFGITNRSNLKDASGLENDPREWFPVFRFSVPELLNLNTEKDVLRLWLVVAHEWRHYEQWQEAPEDEKYFWQHDTPITPAYCKHDWQIEREAYWQECQTAIEWGVPDIPQLELCRRSTNEQAFDQYLFLRMVKNRTSLRTCFRTWAELAGHPNPTAFN